MEDILTSNVFGLLSYLPAAEGLLPFLACATTLDGQRPLANVPQDAQVLYGTSDAKAFWPTVSMKGCQPCEPDLLFQIRPAFGKSIMVMIEAKYLSGKSAEAAEQNEPPRDQLAREWDNLVHLSGNSKTPVLVYLTADVGIPWRDITESQQDYARKRCDSPMTICWLSWRHLHEVVARGRRPIHQDLRLMLDRLDLHFFRRFRIPPVLPRQMWRFIPGEVSFAWPQAMALPRDHWRFNE